MIQTPVGDVYGWDGSNHMWGLLRERTLAIELWRETEVFPLGLGVAAVRLIQESAVLGREVNEVWAGVAELLDRVVDAATVWDCYRSMSRFVEGPSVGI